MQLLAHGYGGWSGGPLTQPGRSGKRVSVSLLRGSRSDFAARGSLLGSPPARPSGGLSLPTGSSWTGMPARPNRVCRGAGAPVRVRSSGWRRFTSAPPPPHWKGYIGAFSSRFLHQHRPLLAGALVNVARAPPTRSPVGRCARALVSMPPVGRRLEDQRCPAHLGQGLQGPWGVVRVRVRWGARMDGLAAILQVAFHNPIIFPRHLSNL